MSELALTDAIGMAADPVGDSPERAALRATLRQLIEAESPLDHVGRLDAAEEFDDHLYERLNDIGVLAIGAPASVVGSAGGDVRDQLVVIEELGAGPTSMAAFMILQYMIIQVLGAYASTDEQRAVLAALVAGRTKVSFALSEPDGATDVVRAMKTRAVGNPRDGWTLSGRKMWTSGALRAQWLVVIARSDNDAEAGPDGAAAKGTPTGPRMDRMSMFLVPTDAPGVHITDIPTLGLHGLSTCEIAFDDVALAPDALVGEEHRGLRQAFATITRENLTASAACLGVGRGALVYAAEFAKTRKVFGSAVGAFQVPQHWLADGAVQLEAARSLMGRAAEIEIAGGRADLLSIMAKLTASEAAQTLTLHGMQLMGGLGYSRDVPLQRWFRDVRLWSFAPLNNEMVRNRIGEKLLGLPRSY
jgi:acyl-CoA dehydrogenase